MRRLRKSVKSDLLASGVLPLALISPILIQAQAQAQKKNPRQQAKIARDVLNEIDVF